MMNPNKMFKIFKPPNAALNRLSHKNKIYSFKGFYKGFKIKCKLTIAVHLLR